MAMELFAKTYTQLYDISLIGLRFFTVYGSWGRPDMSYFKFMNNCRLGKTIKIFNEGDHLREDDAVDGAVTVPGRLARGELVDGEVHSDGPDLGPHEEAVGGQAEQEHPADRRGLWDLDEQVEYRVCGTPADHGLRQQHW